MRVEVLFLVGIGATGDAPRLVLPEEHGRIGTELHLPCPDDYASLPQKTRQFCRWACENRQFTHLFKCDDDTYVVPERLLGVELTDVDYLGSEWATGAGYASGGAGYFLSRRSAELVATDLDASEGAEDQLVGELLRSHDIQFHVDRRFVAYANEDRRPRPENDLVTGHACEAQWVHHETTWDQVSRQIPVTNPALLVIATGRYRCFLESLIASARQFLFPGCPLTVYVFSDEPYYDPFQCSRGRVVWVPTPPAPWPGPALHKAKTILQARELLAEHDCIVLTDADMKFVGRVGSEAVGDLFAVRHPGYVDSPRTALPYETSPTSTACVLENEGEVYYAAGFQGGRREAFFRALVTIADNVEADTAKDITAAWHDESHWNRYLIDYPPEVVLDPRYCCPESWNTPDRRVLALDKDHEAMRRWCHPGVPNCTPHDYIDNERPPCCTQLMKEVLFRVAELLDGSGATWWIDYGTLLGAYRENGRFIPHDSDCDVSVLIEDRTKVVAMKEQLLAEGYDWSDDGVVRVFRSEINRHHTDIFFWERTGDTLELRGYPSTEPSEAQTPVDWIHPMGNIEVMGRVMPCPNRVAVALVHRYGTDFMTPKVY